LKQKKLLNDWKWQARQLVWHMWGEVVVLELSACLPTVAEHYCPWLRWKRHDQILHMVWHVSMEELWWDSNNLFFLLLSLFSSRFMMACQNWKGPYYFIFVLNLILIFLFAIFGFVSFKKIIFFLIPSFNIEFIRNWGL